MGAYSASRHGSLTQKAKAGLCMHTFVTGIGTEVGKTHIVTGLLRQFTQLRGLKPVISGFDYQTQTDSHLILAAMGQAPTLQALDNISPFRYEAPLSVDMAAAQAKKPLPYDELVSFSKRCLAQSSTPCLVEGVGGVMVPLTEDKTTLDWMVDLNIPVVLVASSYLGALSHTLCAYETLSSRHIRIRMIIINQAEVCVGLAQTKQSLSHFIKQIPIFTWPRHQALPPQALIHDWAATCWQSSDAAPAI